MWLLGKRLIVIFCRRKVSKIYCLNALKLFGRENLSMLSGIACFWNLNRVQLALWRLEPATMMTRTFHRRVRFVVSISFLKCGMQDMGGRYVRGHYTV